MHLSSRWITVKYSLLLFLMKCFFPLNHRNRCSNTTMQNLLLSSHFESQFLMAMRTSVSHGHGEEHYTWFIYQKVYNKNVVHLHFNLFNICLIKCIIFYSNFSAPDSPPRDFFVKQLSGVRVRLSWKPPVEPNGIILYYTVYVWYEIFFSFLEIVLRTNINL